MAIKDPVGSIGIPSARFTVLVGNYGSGKTELSLNLALARARQGMACLVDLDVVNPYFRSAEQRALLEAAGLRVLAPTFAMTSVDIPALPPDILSVFEREEQSVVFDVGGDDTGAAALGQYARFFQPFVRRGEADFWFVVNPFRPLSGTPARILDLLGRVEGRARCRMTALLSNPNLGDATDVQTVLEGHSVVQEAARMSGLPIAALAGEAWLEPALPEALRAVFWPVRRYMRPEFFNERGEHGERGEGEPVPAFLVPKAGPMGV